MKNLPYLFIAIFEDGTTYEQGERDQSRLYDDCVTPEDFLAANAKIFGHEPTTDDEREAWAKPCKSAYYDVQNNPSPVVRFILHNRHLGGGEEHAVDLTTGHFFVNGHEIRMHTQDVLRNIQLYFGRVADVDLTADVKFDGNRWNQEKAAHMSEPRYKMYRIGWKADGVPPVIREIDV